MAHPLERFYPWLPVPLQNFGISLYGLAWRHERLGGEFEREVHGFRQRELWTGKRMQAHVEAQLQHTPTRAFDLVPYYQRIWQTNGIARYDLARMTPADLVKLPVTPKKDLRAEPESFVARDMAGVRSLRRYHSSGST